MAMSNEDQPTPTDPGAEAAQETQCAPRRPLWQRFLITIGVVLAVLVVSALLLYKFGSMWVPSAEARTQYAQLEAAGQVPPIENRFHIPIPGCVCHSDDPVKTMQHSTRRISECMGCHGGR